MWLTQIWYFRVTKYAKLYRKHQRHTVNVNIIEITMIILELCLKVINPVKACVSAFKCQLSLVKLLQVHFVKGVMLLLK
jgi:hypothetical protein